MKTAASFENSTQTANFKIMQPQQTQNMYVPSSGNPNGNNIRSNQQAGAFRGPPTQSPTPRGNSRQGHMPNLCQQTLHHSYIVPTYNTFSPRQTPYQNSQFPYPPSIPPPNYYFPNTAIYMQTATHRGGIGVNTGVGGTIVQTGPNVPIGGPSPGGQTSLPISAPVVTGAVPSGTGAVLGVSAAPQISGTQMVGLMPGSITSHPQQTCKQPKSHPNRLKIIDPNTNKNILDDLEPPKNLPNKDCEFSEQAPAMQNSTHSDYPLNASSSQQDPNIGLGSGLIVMNDPIPSISYNMGLADIHQLPQREVICNQTPVVSAITDAPSIEIPPATAKMRPKKVPIISLKEDKEMANDQSNPENIEITEEEEIQNTAIGSIKVLPEDRGQISCKAIRAHESSLNNEQKEIYQSDLKESHEKTNQQINLEKQAQLMERNLNENKSDDILSDSPKIENKNSDSNFSTVDPFKETDDVSIISDRALDEAPLVNNSLIFTTKIAVCKESSSSYNNLFPSAEKRQQIDVNSENFGNPDKKTNNIHETPRNLKKADEVLCDKYNIDNNSECCIGSADFIEITQTSTDETDKVPNILPVALEEHQAIQTDICVDESNKDETEKKNSKIKEVKNENPKLKYLINYKEWQWSPTNPTGKKQYNREQLLQLREAKASQVLPEVKNASILPQLNMLPPFAHKNPKRVQSMMGAIGGNRSGDNNGYAGKQSSISGAHNRSSYKGEKIQINLSLNQDVKLNETDNAWRPRALIKCNENDGNDPEAKAKREKEELIRKVRGILNKLTPEKFEPLVEEIFKLKIDTPDKMQDVMVLVFEKAIDEPNFSVSYANLCNRLITEVKAQDERMEKGTKSHLAQFRIALIDKTEKEFTQNVTGTSAKEAKLKPIVEKIKVCTDMNEKAELEILLEEEERKIRRRSVGTVRFIGELFKISMLTGKIINSCIETLLKGYNEDLLECLCKLLTTVGCKFEQTVKNSKEDTKTCYSLDKTIARMQSIANKSDKEGAKISSRVRFMLQDVIDLRKKNWQMTRNEAPKTMEQIEKDAKNAQLSTHYLNYSGSISHCGTSTSGSQIGSNNKRDDRSHRYGETRYSGSHSQRGDTGSLRRQQTANSTNNSFANGANDENVWHVQTSKGSRITPFDTNKLEGMANQNLETKHLGNVKQYLWNKDIRQSSSNRAATTPTNPFAVLSSLIDSKNNERDLDRERDRNERNGPRNKGSFHKNSMERDRYAMNSRNITNQDGRENSSTRNSQGGIRVLNSSGIQKQASQSKYSQQPSAPRYSSKPSNTTLQSAGSIQSLDLFNSDISLSGNINVVFEELQEADIKSVKRILTDMLESISNSRIDYVTIVSIFNQLKTNQYCGFLYYLLTDYLHLVQVGQTQRRYLANIVSYLLKDNILTIEHFRTTYKHFTELSNDLIVDIPELWSYIFQFCGPLLSRKFITINDLWIKELKEENVNTDFKFGKKFLKTYLNYCIREIGPNFTRVMWKKFNMRWSDFLLEKDIDEFIVTNKFEFIENELKQPLIIIEEPKEIVMNRVIERIDVMLKEGSKAESIIDYINGNIIDIDKIFIKNLTTTLCKYAIVNKEGSYKLDLECFQKICVPVLQRCMDSNEERELECLVSMQLLVNSLEHPRGLLSELFGELYDTDVIPQDSFIKWRDSKDQSVGKGVAVKGLNQFFNMLSAESSDENV